MNWGENMLKIGICDDSKIFLICAEKLIRKWSDERRIPVKIYTFNNGDKLVAANTEERLDIIFLDIIMPLLNGMDAARELRQRDKSVKIIFLTSSPEFALESYEVKAQGYVLKPIAYDKLKELLDECAQSFAEEPKNMVIKTVTGYQNCYVMNRRGTPSTLICIHKSDKGDNLDRYSNLAFVEIPIAKAILTESADEAKSLLKGYVLNSQQKKKLNRIRTNYGYQTITGK